MKIANFILHYHPNNFEMRYYLDIEKEKVLATNFVSMKQKSFQSHYIFCSCVKMKKANTVREDKEAIPFMIL